MNPQQSIITEAERCVMCGLCLPHCPTYQLSHDENESPRGRISLMKLVAGEVFDLTPRLQSHLDHCLLCRACETACPSGVHFGQLMDQTRALLFQDKTTHLKPSLRTRILLLAARSKPWRKLLNRVLYLYQKTGARWLANKSGILKLFNTHQLDVMPPEIFAPVSWKPYYPATREHRGDVALFTGCIANMFDQQTLTSSIAVLNHFGYGVHVPNEQVCCGALHQHQGDIQQARIFMQENIHAFAGLDVERVIITASGCELNLLEQLKSEPDFRHGVTDISSFLLEVWPEHPSLKPVAKRVAVHIPCTQQLIPDSKQNMFKLLAKVPGLELHLISDDSPCCGAAGSHMLEYPQTARQLSTNVFQQLEDIQPDILLTSNIGCALHIVAQIREKTAGIEVIHPVTILSKAIIDP